MLPLAKPALATIAVLSFIGHWQEFMGPLIYMNKAHMRTLALGLQFFRDQNYTQYNLLMAGATDGRYWRECGYPAYGFTPMILERADLNRVHGIDERISIENLLLGIKMTKYILKTLCA